MLTLTARLDSLALFLSGLCLLHCLLMPLAVSLIPLLGTGLLADEVFDRALLLLVIPNSLLALGLGCRHHRRLQPLACGLLGLGVLAASVLSERLESAERAAIVAGAVLLGLAHFCNYRACRRARCPEPHC